MFGCYIYNTNVLLFVLSLLYNKITRQNIIGLQPVQYKVCYKISKKYIFTYKFKHYILYLKLLLFFFSLLPTSY